MTHDSPNQKEKTNKIFRIGLNKSNTRYYMKCLNILDRKRAHKLKESIKSQMAVYCRFGKHKEPLRKFFIFAQGRTGGALLTELTNSHPDIKCDGEILINPIFSPLDYVRRKSLLSDKSIYGFKVKIYQLPTFAYVRKFICSLVGDNWNVIYLFRKNVFRQALSNQFAIHTKKYHFRKGEVWTTKMRVDCDLLLRQMERRENYLEAEKNVLKEINYLQLNYEDNLLREKDWEETCKKVFSYLSLSNVPVTTNLIKSTPRSVCDFVSNYDEVRKVVSQSRFSKYLHMGSDE